MKTKKLSNAEYKDMILHKELIRARNELKGKLKEKWDNTSQRRQSAKVYGHRLSKTKAKRREIKEINKIGKANLYDLFSHEIFGILEPAYLGITGEKTVLCTVFFS